MIPPLAMSESKTPALPQTTNFRPPLAITSSMTPAARAAPTGHGTTAIGTPLYMPAKAGNSPISDLKGGNVLRSNCSLIFSMTSRKKQNTTCSGKSRCLIAFVGSMIASLAESNSKIGGLSLLSSLPQLDRRMRNKIGSRGLPHEIAACTMSKLKLKWKIP